MSADAVVNMAKKQLGIKFTLGSVDPSTGFDDSGLVVYCFKQAVGMTLPHNITKLINMGTAIPKSKLKPGDIIFPSGGHVGIYIGNNQFIHTSNQDRVVKISKVYSYYIGRRLL